MVIAKIYGGLGNQMFQYAMARSLAIEKKKKIVLDISRFDNYKLHKYSLQHFNIKAKFYKEPNRYLKKIQNFLFKKATYTEINFGFDNRVFKLRGDYIFLDGYFQSEKYFSKYKDEIRRDFEIKSKLKFETQDIINYINTVNSVSLHIRRGDYVNNPKHYIDTESYYQKAVEIIESKVKNPVFFIFSDDMDWVKSNLSLKYETVFVDFNDALSNFEDLKLMSTCQHNIITNSSFSWWGAWLNKNENKIVIAPKKWFNDDTNSNDIIPDSWLKV
jgi:hypothetical protein